MLVVWTGNKRRSRSWVKIVVKTCVKTIAELRYKENLARIRVFHLAARRISTDIDILSGIGWTENVSWFVRHRFGGGKAQCRRAARRRGWRSLHARLIGRPLGWRGTRSRGPSGRRPRPRGRCRARHASGGSPSGYGSGARLQDRPARRGHVGGGRRSGGGPIKLALHQLHRRSYHVVGSHRHVTRNSAADEE